MKVLCFVLLVVLAGCNSILGIGPPHGKAEDAGVRVDATDAAVAPDGPSVAGPCTFDSSHFDDGCVITQ